MPSRKLTARTVETLKAAPEGVLEVWDTELPGFGIRVAPSGAKTWFVRYRHAGRRKRLKLGTYPRLSLAEARKEARKALGKVELGTDPAAEKAADRRAPTFGFLAAEYLEKHAAKKKSEREDKRIINKELLPNWGPSHAKEIRRPDVIALLDSIAERPAPIMANRTLALARKIYNFGIQRGLVDLNPCVLVDRPGGKEKRRNRVLKEDEIRRLWAELGQEAFDVAAVFRIRLLTAQRGGEVMAMRWAEIDMTSGWWTIPAERSKNDLPHRVPVTAPVLEILEILHDRAAGSPWVFPGRRGNGPLVNVQKAVERVRNRVGFDFCGHDLRRTAASYMTSMGISRLVVGRILNHAEPGVTATYDRHSYDREKRQALEAWAQRVTEIVSGTSERARVVPMVRR